MTIKASSVMRNVVVISDEKLMWFGELIKLIR